MGQIGIDILIFVSSYFIAIFFQKIMPRLFSIIPFAIFAGFLGLSFKLFNFQFSEHNQFYTDLFLSFIFAGFPLAIGQFDKKFFKKVLPLWRYSIFQYLIQWGGSLVLVTYLLKYFFDIGDEFGSYLPSGFAGGHGSAAVVGDLLQRGGIADAISFTMFSATVGILFSVLGGIILCKIYKRKFILKSFNLNEKAPLVLPDAIILCMSVLLSFIAQPLIIKTLKVNIPGFVISVLISFIFRQLFGARDAGTLNRISNLSTDLLVIVGIGSINFTLIKASLIPLSILFLFGLTQGVLVFLFLSKRVFKESDSFEKALFTWGWSIGGLVIGLNLVQSLEVKHNKNILEEFAMTYLMISPLEISILLFGPWLILNGHAQVLGTVLFLLAIILLTYMYRSSRSS